MYLGVLDLGANVNFLYSAVGNAWGGPLLLAFEGAVQKRPYLKILYLVALGFKKNTESGSDAKKVFATSSNIYVERYIRFILWCCAVV